MSPRPRKVSDDQIFEAVYRAMQRVPAAELTLAEVGREAGITASAVVQRFGSKQGLLRALNARFAKGTESMLAGLRQAAPTPLAAIRAYAECFAGMIASRETLAHHLGYLQADLQDPVTFRHVQRHTRTTRATLTRWVEEAVAAGELRLVPDGRTGSAGSAGSAETAGAEGAAGTAGASGGTAESLARAIHTAVNGSMMTYPFFREGAPVAWLRADLELALRPYLPDAR